MARRDLGPVARFAAGIWLFVLGGILCSASYWRGVPLIVAAALQFLAGYYLLSSAQSRRVKGKRPASLSISGLGRP